MLSVDAILDIFIRLLDLHKSSAQIVSISPWNKVQSVV